MAKHIQPEKARALAYTWHGGMSSPLYAFASSGLIASHLALLGEIRECERIAETVTDKRNVRALYRFARDCVAHIPDKRYPHAAPWAKGGVKKMLIHKNHPDVDTILHHYLICALWASSDKDGNPLDDGFSLDDIAQETKDKAREDVTDFILLCMKWDDEYGIQWREYWTLEQFDHDLFLTRAGHGTGFWDRYSADHPAHEIGEKLTEASYSMGHVNFYPGDDGKVYST